MHKLMKGDYYLESLALCNGETTVVLIDVLIKHGVYVHPFGKIFAFTEQAKETLIIDGKDYVKKDPINCLAEEKMLLK